MLLFVAFAASYPSAREAANDDQSERDLELELRSILNHLTDEQDSEEQMRRSISTGKKSSLIDIVVTFDEYF